MTENFNPQDAFIQLLRDQHRQLLNRKDFLRHEARMLALDIDRFEHNLKELKKLLGKNKEPIQMLWSLKDDGDAYVKLAKLEVTDPEDPSKTVPFFSESYLYRTIGKEDARTVLALLNTIFINAGKPAPF
jgi:hypothetical protein